MTAITKTNYRVPCCTVDAEVSLNQFQCYEMAEYLRQHGYYVSRGSASLHDQDPVQPNTFDPDDLAHIETLAVCGQIEAARAEALALVSSIIERVL